MKESRESLIKEINQTRTKMLNILDEYNQLLSNMSEYENMFLTHVIFPGYQLQLTIQKRKYLEREYKRIQKLIKSKLYSDPEQLRTDIRQIITDAEVQFAYKENEHVEVREDLKAKSPTTGLLYIDADTMLDEQKKEEIIREFKRVVIPQVHSDTSDTPFEVFNNVYTVYKKEDYLLMQAFTIQYRGEISADHKVDVDTLKTYSQEYSSVLERFEKRIKKLKWDITIKELENPEVVQQEIKRQNREIRKAIYDESERILHIINQLEVLAQTKLPKSKDEGR